MIHSLLATLLYLVLTYPSFHAPLANSNDQCVPVASIMVVHECLSDGDPEVPFPLLPQHGDLTTAHQSGLSFPLQLPTVAAPEEGFDVAIQ